MAEQTEQQIAEEGIADVLFGPEEPEVEEEYEPKPVPVVEGDESDDEELKAEDTDEVEEAPELVEFEWEGQLLEAPPAIKEALMRQQDYTQKTQELSAQRKAADITASEIAQQRASIEFTQSMLPDLVKAQNLEQTAEQYQQLLRDNIDQLSATDIEKIRMERLKIHAERDGLVQSLTQRQQEHQQAQEQARVELLNKGTEVLRSKLPDWGEAAQKSVHDYALNSGYTEAEISQVVDPRHVEVLWKASRYDALQQGKTAAVKAVQNAPTIKPKSRNPMPKETQDKLNLRKKLKNQNLKASDKADLIANDIANSPLFR